MDQIKGTPPLRFRHTAVLLVFLSVAGFVSAIVNRPISDDMLLVESRLALDGVNSFANFFRENYWGEMNPGGTYRPLSLCLLSLQKLVFGMNLVGYRVVSLLLHAVCTLLVWRILARMLRADPALFGAALFACHPIHAECVITVYGQIDLWSALFFLIAFDLAVAPAGQVRKRPSGLPLAAYLASLLCKESGVLLPVVVVAYQRLFSGDDRLKKGADTVVRSTLRAVPATGWAAFRVGDLAWLAPLGAYALMRLSVFGLQALPTGGASVGTGASLVGRITLVVVTLGNYLRLMLVPWGQTTYHGHLRDNVTGMPWVETTLLVGGVVAVSLLPRLIGQRRTIFAVVWIVALLAPVANVVPIGIIVAERCLYLPSVALALVVAACLEWLQQSGRVPLRALAVLCAVFLVVPLTLCLRVDHRWRDSPSHWQATVSDHPNSPKAHAAVGTILLNELIAELLEKREVKIPPQRLAEIESHLDRALVLNPNSVEALTAKGRLAILQEDFATALEFLERAQTLRPSPELERLIQACRQGLARNS